MEKATWRDMSTALRVGSVMVGAIAVALPEIYSKIGLAVALGLANGAMECLKQEGAKT